MRRPASVYVLVVSTILIIYTFFTLDLNLIEALQVNQRNDQLDLDLIKQQFVRTYPNVTLEEKDKFLRIKTDEYLRRRETIQSFCRNSSEPEFSRQIINNSLVYDAQDEVSYCMIPKAASSTWCTHFIDLGNPSKRIRSQYSQALQFLAPKLFPAPPLDTLQEAWSKTTSLVVVRHPLARLASVYQEKFVKYADNKSWGPLGRNIISMYRQKIEPREIIKPENENIPTPEEMIRFVTYQLNSMKRVDQHWKPQHESCPFCLLDFTVYARVEEINEDTLFFLITSGLEGRLNPGIRINPSTHDERTFWSQVYNETISELLHPYQQDFLMFNYSARAYLENLNIPFSSALIYL
ncbi:carbohydrate sulfotransferase 11 isoform X2 [Eurytemora carolleeae]|uniref:carbohydrate sulfotransferase 11 isoform X2 n=1 Tax=Eurytemora carolleeae TaxID=1294199 RepID=UPI000C7668AA|nr:carbohydrate sulfotransferase 11 isoform X2 [Eurytemora carolleeae]|eukprot:XP_023326363.1 carbohydrate sulfotransferase 11-like isoform X2 [Eurytemora affinis]